MHRCRTRAASRSGTVLIIVLVVIVLLALGAYTFSEFMVLEAKSSQLHGQAVRARALADSGVELVATQLATRTDTDDPMFVYDNPQFYRGHPLSDGNGGLGRFSVIAPNENDPAAATVRYGLMDESGKLNLNAILGMRVNGEQISPEDARWMLSYLPYSDPSIVDCILDFIDEDDEPREYGAESETYGVLGYYAKNGPLESLDELLMVQGVTPELLFGEDANRNGLLDPSENDAEATLPLDNADGLLDRGWAAYLTVHAKERNTQVDGAERIYVNDNILTDLYDSLVESFDEETATFIVAYRLSGPFNPESSNPGNSNTPAAPGLAALGQISANSQSSDQAGLEAARALGQAIAGSDGSGNITRGGMNLNAGSKFTFNSLYDLVGAQVQATVNGTQTLLESPWPDDPAAMADYLPELVDKLTLAEGDSREGRININQAPFEVIAGIPESAGMTPDLATAIADAQQAAASGMMLSEDGSSRGSTAWLYQEGLVDLATLRKLDPFITARGDVYRVQVVGFFDTGGPTSRVEAIIDASGTTPEIVFMRDLTDLGRGFPASLLGAE